MQRQGGKTICCVSVAQRLEWGWGPLRIRLRYPTVRYSAGVTTDRGDSLERTAIVCGLSLIRERPGSQGNSHGLQICNFDVGVHPEHPGIGGWGPLRIGATKPLARKLFKLFMNSRTRRRPRLSFRGTPHTAASPYRSAEATATPPARKCPTRRSRTRHTHTNLQF